MAQIASVTHNSIDISSEVEVLSYTYTDVGSIVVIARIDLGETKPLSGSGQYFATAYVNGLVALPSFPINVANGVHGFSATSKQFVLNQDDEFSLHVTGLVGDTDVDCSAVLVGDATSADAESVAQTFSSLDSVKLSLGIALSDTSQDERLQQLLEQSTAMIQDYLQRDVFSQSYVEILCGAGTPVLNVANGPIISVSEIRVEAIGSFGQDPDAFGDETVLTYGTDYCFQGNTIFRRGGVWPALYERETGLLAHHVTPGFGTVKISYVGGFSSVPRAIETACQTLVQVLLAQTAEDAAVTKEKTQDYEVSYMTSGVLAKDALDPMDYVKPQLSKYRRITL